MESLTRALTELREQLLLIDARLLFLQGELEKQKVMALQEIHDALAQVSAGKEGGE